MLQLHEIHSFYFTRLPIPVVFAKSTTHGCCWSAVRPTFWQSQIYTFANIIEWWYYAQNLKNRSLNHIPHYILTSSGIHLLKSIRIRRIIFSRREHMKRRELLKLFTNNGWYFLRNGANHDIYTNGKDNVPIPRHPDINEVLARALIKKWGLK